MSVHKCAHKLPENKHTYTRGNKRNSASETCSSATILHAACFKGIRFYLFAAEEHMADLELDRCVSLFLYACAISGRKASGTCRSSCPR